MKERNVGVLSGAASTSNDRFIRMESLASGFEILDPFPGNVPPNYLIGTFWDIFPGTGHRRRMKIIKWDEEPMQRIKLLRKRMQNDAWRRMGMPQQKGDKKNSRPAPRCVAPRTSRWDSRNRQARGVATGGMLHEIVAECCIGLIEKRAGLEPRRLAYTMRGS